MPGITATSVSASVSSPSTDNAASGYLTGERVRLGTTPSGTSYTWKLASPSDSGRARSALDDESSSAPSFVPDVGGTYLVTVNVDGTSYTLRLTVQSVSVSEPVEVVRFSPRADSSVPRPAAGVAVYFSSNQNALVQKDSSGVIRALTVGSPL